MTLPTTLPRGSNRVSPFTQLVHDWRLRGADQASTAGLMERFENPDVSFVCEFNADRMGTHVSEEDGEPIRPMHGYINYTMNPGLQYRAKASNPHFNDFAWQLSKWIYPPEDVSDADHTVLEPQTDDNWVDKKKAAGGAGDLRRAFVTPMLDVYIRGRDSAQKKRGFDSFKNWCWSNLYWRMLSHVWEQLSGRYHPYVGEADEVNDNDCFIKYHNSNPDNDERCESTPLHMRRGWRWEGTWQEHREHDSDPTGYGFWTGPKNFKDQSDEDECNRDVLCYGHNGFDTTDRGHNETEYMFVASMLGLDEGYVTLWAHYRMAMTCYKPPWSLNVHMGSQPRELAMAIKLARNAWMAGFEWADPDLIDAQCNGVLPSELLDYALRWSLTSRFSGGIGVGSAGCHLDSSNSNRGDGNLLGELCEDAKTNFGTGECGASDPETSPDCWWTYLGDPHWRAPAYGRYIWQGSMLMLEWARALRLRDDVLAQHGVKIFEDDLYQGIQDALDTFHDYYAELGILRAPSDQGDPPDVVAYTISVDKYHSVEDQSIAGNRYHHRQMVDVVDPGELLKDPWDQLRISFRDVCGENKWDESNPKESRIRIHQHPISNRWYTFNRDSSDTGAFMLIAARSAYFGWEDAYVQRVVNGPSWRVRGNYNGYLDTWMKYSEVYYSLKAHSDFGGGPPNVTVNVGFGVQITNLSKNPRDSGGFPLPSVTKFPRLSLEFETGFDLEVIVTQDQEVETGFRMAPEVFVDDGTTELAFVNFGVTISIDQDRDAETVDVDFGWQFEIEALYNPPPDDESDQQLVVFDTGMDVTVEVFPEPEVDTDFGFQLEVLTDTSADLDTSFALTFFIKDEDIPPTIDASFGFAFQIDFEQGEIMAFDSVGIDHPVWQTRPNTSTAAGSLPVRIFRIPSTNLDATAAYLIQRADSEEAFRGLEGTDYITLTQNFQHPPSDEPWQEHTIDGQPTDRDLYYRLVAVDNLADKHLFSQPSNIIIFRHRKAVSDPTKTAMVPVTTWPCDLQPESGPLKGLVNRLVIDSPQDGVTWHSFAKAHMRAAQDLRERLLGILSEATVEHLFRHPTAAVETIFTYKVLKFLIPEIGLTASARAVQEAAASEVIQRADQELLRALADEQKDTFIEARSTASFILPT